MARVDAYLSAEAGNGRTVSLGGRSSNSSIYATVNTDNGRHSDCAVTVHAYVRGERELGGKPRKTCDHCSHNFEKGGVLRYRLNDSGEVEDFVSHETHIEAGDRCPNCKKLRQGQDTRVSHFDIQTPRQDDAYCKVSVNGQPISKLVFLDDEQIVEQVKKRGLYDRIVTELFGKNPLLDNILETVES